LRVFFFLLVLLTLVVPSAGQAQQVAPITLQVQAGYGAGVYRLSNWFPVTFEIANDGPDIRATIEWRFRDIERGVFQREVDLPRGARKRLTMQVVSNDFARSAEVRVFNGTTELLKQNVRLDPVDSGQFIVGVLSTDRSLLNSLSILQLDRTNGTTVTHLDPALLPEDSVTLSTFNALFIHDVATADLAPAQREAIALWTRLGGQLVISGGVSAERSAPGFNDLLPVDIGPLQADRSLEELERFARRNDLSEVVPSTTLNSTTLRPGARPLDGEGILSAIDQGAGRVVFSAFDFTALRAWAGEPELWQRVLRAESRMDVGYTYRIRGDNLLRSTLRLANLNFPSSFMMVGLVLLYVVLVGPVNFLVLRRMRRPDLAWITVPAIVLVCLLGTYGASFVLRGSQPQLLQLTIAQGFEGQQQGQATAFLGVFSPQRRDYRLTVDSRSLISGSTFDGFEANALNVTSTDTNNQVRDLLIDVSSLRTLMLEQSGVAIPLVSSQLQRTTDRVDGQVTYQGALPLEDAMLVYGNSFTALGTLNPGQNIEVSLNSDLGNFPEGTFGDNSRIFERGQVIYNMYDFDRFSFNGPNFDGTRGMPERDGVYLLGWGNDTLLPMQLENANAEQQGMVLYIIRLNTR
jgi:hypothetical protein